MTTEPQPSNPASADNLRSVQSRFFAHAANPFPPPQRTRAGDRLLWGLAQPFLGMRLVVSNRDLLGSAAAPALLVALFCALVPLADDKVVTAVDHVRKSFVTFVALAPVPPLLFARHYARIAARVRDRIGLGPCDPYYRSVGACLTENVLQLIAIGIGLAPVTILVGLAPILGIVWAAILGGLWTLHWVVVEAFDSARTLDPGETVADVEHDSRMVQTVPWFVRIYRLPTQVPWAIRGPLRTYGRLVDAVTRFWRAEVELISRNPFTSIGFGLGTALLLATPGINLLFRAAVIAGASHVRSRLEYDLGELDPATGTLAVPTSTSPYPAVMPIESDDTRRHPTAPAFHDSLEG